MTTELPLADGPPPRERADAARNRAKVLAAAERLFAEGDPTAVTMDDIARTAGIGRGTLYRRYPDRASIARALLDEHERALQERLLRGAPPLGPGGADGAAPPPRSTHPTPTTPPRAGTPTHPTQPPRTSGSPST
ncbi:helix-turn-helix domain-containing protein, partial [Kitasatospora sp. NPDC002551]|uniref:TetR/AcrR family transcriptional regulator n=1 Tax=Kitasatospora sp. NPDC002551 TaxID=3154539 RepID=UPI003327CE41